MPRLLVRWLLVTTWAFALAGGAAAQPFAFATDTNDTDDLYRLDLATGVATLVGSTVSTDVEALALRASDGTLFGVSDDADELLTCDRLTGACTVVGSLGVSISDPGLELGCDGTLYLTSEGGGAGGGNLYRVDMGSGAATLIGALGAFDGQSLAQGAPRVTCPSGMYALDGNSDDPRLSCVDLASGTATVIGNLGVSIDGQPAMDFAADGTLWVVENQNGSDAYTVDPVTALATDAGFDIAPAGVGFDGLAIEGELCGGPSVVDVPALSIPGLAALFAGLALAGWRLLRRRPAGAEARERLREPSPVASSTTPVIPPAAISR
jgi:hypothetical protein